MTKNVSKLFINCRKQIFDCLFLYRLLQIVAVMLYRNTITSGLRRHFAPHTTSHTLQMFNFYFSYFSWQCSQYFTQLYFHFNLVTKYINMQFCMVRTRYSLSNICKMVIALIIVYFNIYAFFCWYLANQVFIQFLILNCTFFVLRV